MFESTVLKSANLQYIYLWLFCQVYRVTDEALIAKTRVMSHQYINSNTVLEGTQHIFY